MSRIKLWWAAFVADWRRFWLLDEEEETLPAKKLKATYEVAPEAPTVQAVLRRWIALRTGGGGRFETPQLYEDAAIEYVTRRGTHSIVSVDRENGYIFYADKR